MKYFFQEYTVQQLVELIDNNQIDLNPSYQRNFIWSPDDQKELIDSVLIGYPLPNFFVYEIKLKYFEMVDGQQRSKTIYRFVKGLITSSKKSGSLKFENVDNSKFLNYKLPVILIKNLTEKDSLKDFYVLINKKGIHLNTPEINKSEYHDSLFLKLASEVLTYQKLINLNLFTEASVKRMNDRAFIEELLGYLKLGIKDKKIPVETIYQDDINSKEFEALKEQFYLTIDRIDVLNNIRPIRNTRYKQKNDFYTLFSFVHENQNLDQKVINYQYQILLVLDGVDKDGKQFIRPTNDQCKPLKEYAINCVSQSNSKNARDSRLSFLNAILKNNALKHNEILTDVLNYLGTIYGEDKIDIISVDGFQLLNIELLEKISA